MSATSNLVNKAEKESKVDDKNPETRMIWWEEIQKNNTAESLWFVIDNEVYDVTNYNSHPGQFKILLQHGGIDATQAFVDRGHSNKAKILMKKYKIGQLKDTDTKILKKKEKTSWLVYFDRTWMTILYLMFYYIVYLAAISKVPTNGNHTDL